MFKGFPILCLSKVNRLVIFYVIMVVTLMYSKDVQSMMSMRLKV